MELSCLPPSHSASNTQRFCCLQQLHLRRLCAPPPAAPCILRRMLSEYPSVPGSDLPASRAGALWLSSYPCWNLLMCFDCRLTRRGLRPRAIRIRARPPASFTGWVQVCIMACSCLHVLELADLFGRVVQVRRCASTRMATPNNTCTPAVTPTANGRGECSIQLSTSAGTYRCIMAQLWKQRRSRD